MALTFTVGGISLGANVEVTKLFWSCKFSLDFVGDLLRLGMFYTEALSFSLKFCWYRFECIVLFANAWVL